MASVIPRNIPRVFDNNLDNLNGEKKNNFNYWMIFLTAIIFFTVLSFYTFLLSLFGYFVRKDDDKDKDNRETVWGLLAFFLLWLALLIGIYIILDSNGLLFT